MKLRRDFFVDSLFEVAYRRTPFFALRHPLTPELLPFFGLSWLEIAQTTHGGRKHKRYLLLEAGNLPAPERCATAADGSVLRLEFGARALQAAQTALLRLEVSKITFELAKI